MKNLIYILFSALISSFVTAQIHEVGVFAGGSNYIGDVGSTQYINPNAPAFGLLYKMNRSPRHAYRFSISTGNLSADDTKSNIPSRELRGFKMKNNLKEISAGIEFNFFEYDLHNSRYAGTPYVFTGINFAVFDLMYIDQSKESKDYNNGSTIAIPMVVGYKKNISAHWNLAAEIGVRYTFSDNLDGSNPENGKYSINRFGNFNSNDWYVFSGLSLTYTFGKNPCFCD